MLFIGHFRDYRDGLIERIPSAQTIRAVVLQPGAGLSYTTYTLRVLRTNGVVRNVTPFLAG